MAQLVEQRIRNAWVAGSSPASGSTGEKRDLRASFFTDGLDLGGSPPLRSVDYC